MAAERKVLVLGDDTRSFLATVRSLGRRGITVHAAPYDRSAPALASRYIAAVHMLPYYLGDGSDWLAAMRRLLVDERYDLVIPCEERSLLPLHRHRAELAPLARLAVPDARGIDAFFDKVATRELALSCGVPVPPGRTLREGDTAAGLIAEFGLPLVLKHRKSYDWSELYVRKAAAVLDSAQAIEGWLRHNVSEPADVLVEGLFAGLGGGLSVLCHEGRVLQAFEHRRAHEVAGSSFYRCSAPVDPGRLEAVGAMAQRIAYTGLAMFELKLAPDRGWCLLEVNARPWGSLPLPVALGVDFPYHLYRLLVDGAVEPRAAYATDMYGRNFVPDLWQLRSNLGSKWRRPLAALAYLSRWVWDFRRVLTGREHQDLRVSDDPAPARAEWREFARDRLQSLSLLRHRAERRLAEEDRERLRHCLSRMQGVRRVVFVCQGNICRSPYAEHRLRTMLAGANDVEITSAGLLPRNPRPSPATAQEAAAARGVDLVGHRSRHASGELLGEAALIVLFDEVNLRHLRARHPELRERAVHLGTLDPAGGPIEIADPDRRSRDVFDATYARIDRCLEALRHMLVTPHA